MAMCRLLDALQGHALFRLGFFLTIRIAASILFREALQMLLNLFLQSVIFCVVGQIQRAALSFGQFVNQGRDSLVVADFLTVRSLRS